MTLKSFFWKGLKDVEINKTKGRRRSGRDISSDERAEVEDRYLIFRRVRVDVSICREVNSNYKYHRRDRVGT